MSMWRDLITDTLKWRRWRWKDCTGTHCLHVHTAAYPASYPWAWGDLTGVSDKDVTFI